eukprot:CAMPEP_0178426406 /NCGR_PEP_ID=MMETSP0689_2-20121128/29218_1 /TAXON_ID=160604 /ORGANISM="Amphidinium massartii, Strain CS-259" /LENGTH=461 /DNA_ID=CAMNT_0020048091 /DNA_START=105 /DNA_END=1486 /DNA_ORIENTATION=-
MNEVFIAWAGLIAIFFLRALQNWKCTQAVIHSCSCMGSVIARLLQWYSLAFLFLTLMLARTFWDIVKYDYIGYNFLRSERIAENLELIKKDNPDVTSKELSDLHLRPWLKALSLSAPAVGVLTFLIVLYQVRGLIRQSQRVRGPGDKYPWWMRDLMHVIVLVLANPLLFVVMSMRATIRVLAVMTGSAWIPQHRLPVEDRLTWAHIVDLEMSTFTADLEIAYAVQFFTVWIFGSMCGSLMAGADFLKLVPYQERQQYKKTMIYAAIQGIYAYVVIGLIRCGIDIAVAFLLQSDKPESRDKAAKLEDELLPKIATIFMFVTLLCIFNMIVIGKVKAITSALGNATAKFLALRLLLLIAQTQLQILMGCTTGSKIYLNIMQHEGQIQPLLDKYVPSWHWQLTDWDFSEYQAKLLHASLLSYECLVMVLLNLICWKLNDEQAYKITAFTFKDHEHQKASGASEP